MRAEGVSSGAWAPQQLTAGTAETDCVSTLRRAVTLFLHIGFDQLQNAAEELVEWQSYSEALDQTILLKLNVSAPSETNSSHFL